MVLVWQTRMVCVSREFRRFLSFFFFLRFVHRLRWKSIVVKIRGTSIARYRVSRESSCERFHRSTIFGIYDTRISAMKPVIELGRVILDYSHGIDSNVRRENSRKKSHNNRKNLNACDSLIFSSRVRLL